MVKTIGILGGMGPLATVRLFENIVVHTQAKSDQDHIPILIYNNPQIEDRTDYILGKIDRSPEEKLVNSAKKLEKMGADFLIMPCNTAHYFYNNIVENINIPFLNMIEETAKYLREQYPNINKVGLLATSGTIEARIYHDVFQKYGIEVINPTRESQKYVTELIYSIKEGKHIDRLDRFYRAKKEVEDQGVEVFVAGCTEISVAIDLYKLEGDILDPMLILALESIDYAGGVIKPF